MTPQKYLKIEAEQEAIIDAALRIIAVARDKADQCPLPAKLRPAEASDIKEGAVIWYPHWDERKWALVESPLHHGDAFKAFTDDRGCRYGLSEAFVEDASSPVDTPESAAG